MLLQQFSVSLETVKMQHQIFALIFLCLSFESFTFAADTTKKKIVQKIGNGGFAERGQFKFVAVLRDTHDDEYLKVICGASIINPRFALTVS